MMKILKDIYTLFLALFIIPLGLGYALMIQGFIRTVKFYHHHISWIPFRIYALYYRFFARYQYNDAPDIMARTIMRRLNGHHDPEQGVFIFLNRYDPPMEIVEAHIERDSFVEGLVSDIEEACREQWQARNTYTAKTNFRESLHLL